MCVISVRALFFGHLDEARVHSTKRNKTITCRVVQDEGRVLHIRISNGSRQIDRIRAFEYIRRVFSLLFENRLYEEGNNFTSIYLFVDDFSSYDFIPSGLRVSKVVVMTTRRGRITNVSFIIF